MQYIPLSLKIRRVYRWLRRLPGWWIKSRSLAFCPAELRREIDVEPIAGRFQIGNYIESCCIIILSLITVHDVAFDAGNGVVLQRSEHSVCNFG
jgi:hypothetical protein